MDMYQLRDRVAALPALNKRLDVIRTEIAEAEDNVVALLKQSEKESRDVAKIRDESLSAFLYRLVGRYDTKLEKEQNEEIQAKMAYDQAVARLNGLHRDQNDLAARIAQLLKDKSVYDAELDDRRQKIAAKMSEPGNKLYHDLQEERNTMIAQMTEVDEALRALSRANESAAKIADSLNSADGWAVFDIISDSMIADMAKYSHIDEAEAEFQVLSYELQALQSEMRDVEGFLAFEPQAISSFDRTFDFWFDNIFTDFSVQGQIQDNAAQMNELIKTLNATETALNEKRRNLESALAENKRSEEELLLTLS